ncbi:hypothetical protein AB0B12_10405 [Streptomyces sp. NPDC044780]|uniref:hypothetical protein n=1 Tax=unclassified Streptomyces TaxID=2593676 RepID=UPI0033EAE21B
MQIRKKAALLTAAAGTLVLLGTGTAVANGTSGTSPTSFDVSTFIFQSNKCDTSNGWAYSGGMGAPSGDINIGATCVNNIGG